MLSVSIKMCYYLLKNIPFCSCCMSPHFFYEGFPDVKKVTENLIFVISKFCSNICIWYFGSVYCCINISRISKNAQIELRRENFLNLHLWLMLHILYKSASSRSLIPLWSQHYQPSSNLIPSSTQVSQKGYLTIRTWNWILKKYMNLFDYSNECWIPQVIVCNFSNSKQL